MEKRTKSLLEAATKDHPCPCLFFFPAVEIAIAVAARASQIMADLRIDIDHCRLPSRPLVLRRCNRELPNRIPEQRLQGSDKNARSGRPVTYGQLRGDSIGPFHPLGRP